MGAGAAMVRAIGPPDHMFFCACILFAASHAKLNAILVWQYASVAEVGSAAPPRGAAAMAQAGNVRYLFCSCSYHACVMTSMLSIPRSVMQAFFAVLPPLPPALLRARCPDAYRLHLA